MKGEKLLRQDDFLKGQLVLAGWRHGHVFGGWMASCMVISCLANRQKLGWGNWLEVLNTIPNYSATIEQPTGMPSIWEPSFVRLLSEVPNVYDGSKDFAKGGLYWADLSKPIDNPWFQEKILNNLDMHPRVCDMGSLTIFR